MPNRDQIVEIYEQRLNRGLTKLMNFAGFPVETRAEGCTIYDEQDCPFLDFLGGYGVFSLGHRHPQVVEAVQKQLERMPLSSKAFFNPVAAELAEKLISWSPGYMDYCFFVNSGTEAVETCLKFARIATLRPGFISTHGAYHGKTLGALSVTGRDVYRLPCEPLLPGVTFVPYGDADAVANAISDQTAAVIVEPIQGEGGIIIPPDDYLSRLQVICERAGALLIFDEVQTGLGRTGEFFASSHGDSGSADLIALAKALGGGVMPLGAVIGTHEVWEKVFGENPLLHTSTFGGNPLACAAGIAALDVIINEKLCERSAVMGEKMLSGLKSIAAEHPDLIKEARGRGLMIGVEFTMDDLAELVTAQMLARQVLVAYTLNNPRVIRFEPPLIVNEVQIDEALHAFAESVAAIKELLADID